MAGACPVLNNAGTAKIPQIPKNEAVILYLLIVSANGPFFCICCISITLNK